MRDDSNTNGNPRVKRSIFLAARKFKHIIDSHGRKRKVKMNYIVIAASRPPHTMARSQAHAHIKPHMNFVPITVQITTFCLHVWNPLQRRPWKACKEGRMKGGRRGMDAPRGARGVGRQGADCGLDCGLWPPSLPPSGKPSTLHAPPAQRYHPSQTATQTTLYPPPMPHRTAPLRKPAIVFLHKSTPPCFFLFFVPGRQAPPRRSTAPSISPSFQRNTCHQRRISLERAGNIFRRRLLLHHLPTLHTTLGVRECVIRQRSTSMCSPEHSI